MAQGRCAGSFRLDLKDPGLGLISLTFTNFDGCSSGRFQVSRRCGSSLNPGLELYHKTIVVRMLTTAGRSNFAPIG